MAQTKALELTIQIAGRIDRSLDAAIQQAQSRVSGLSKMLGNIGAVGLGAMGNIAMESVATIVKCTDEAEKFESQMGDVVKYVGGLADSTGKISDLPADNGQTYAENYAATKTALLDLSTQIPMTAEDLTRLAASAGQSGKSISDLIQYDSSGNITGFLKDAAMMATAMDISADQAGDWAAKWENSFHMSHEQVMELADQINYLGANSATTAAEIASAVNDAASLGQIGGIDVKTTAALADAMLATGVDSGKVATSVKRTISNISQGSSATEKMKEQWEELGFTAEGVAKSMQEDSVETLKSIFSAIGNLPQERQVAALSTLFGQWAIEGDAKIVGNMNVFEDALNMVNDPSKYMGSMEREFVIKASTSESIDMMRGNALKALQIEIGDSFLPVKKQFNLLFLDIINSVRKMMPQISQIADHMAAFLSEGVTKAGNALEKALPYIQQALDYLANHGPEVVSVLGKLAAAFAALKFAPAAEGILGNLIFGEPQVRNRRSSGRSGGLLGLFHGGQNLAGMASSTAQWIGDFVGATRANMDLTGLTGLSGFLSTAGSALFGGVGNAAANINIGQYLGGVFSSLGNFLDVSGISGIASEILGSQGINLAGLPGELASRVSLIANGMGGLAGSIVNSTPVQAASGLVGRVVNSAPVQAIAGIPGAVLNSAPIQTLGGFVGNAAPVIGNVAGAGLGALGNIWAPIVSGFGSLATGAAPVIAAISGIIAVVSILGDHLEDIRGIVSNVFGDAGLTVFDGFIGKISAVGQFVSGLFQDGGVATALAPLQEAVTNLFGGDAGAAFGGLTQILQSIMGVVGQVVNFATTTVKPIIQDVFSFLTGTVMPIILQTFTAAAPIISSIITNIGTAIMTGMQIIGTAIQIVMPVIQGIITAVMNIASIVIPAVLAGFQAFSAGISEIATAVQGIFQGVIDFITGVFTGNWEQAWQAVQDIFGNIFDGLVALVKTPLNTVISFVNQAISRINGLNISIPEWVPVVGGKSFSPHIPTIPELARGGFTSGPSIAGEAGREAVISFQNHVHEKNIDTWIQAGQMLGVSNEQAMLATGNRFETMGRNIEPAMGNLVVLAGLPGKEKENVVTWTQAGQMLDISREQAMLAAGNSFRTIEPVMGTPVTLKEIPEADTEEHYTITFAPQITVQGNADQDILEDVMRNVQKRFESWYDDIQKNRARKAY